MPDDAEELRVLRARVEDLAATLKRITRRAPESTPVMVGRVFAGPTVPTAKDKFFSTHPAEVTAAATEGGVGSAAVDTGRTVLMDVIGPGVPVANDYIIGLNADWRWAARWPTTGTGISVPGCEGLCTDIPATLHQTMTGTDVTGLINPCTYTWQVPPFGGVGMAFWSEPFLDGLGRTFRYHLLCSGGDSYVMRLERADPDNPLTNIWRWVIAGSNTCHPFKLLTGTSLAGGAYVTFNPQVQE